MSISEEDIDVLHRVPVRDKSRISPIIVQFRERKKRDELLEKRDIIEDKNGVKVKEKKKITQEDIIGNGVTDQLIYVKENQSPYYRSLEIKTKKIAKTYNQWKFVWFNDGKLFIKKNDQSNATRIKDDNDLERIFGTAELEKVEAELKMKQSRNNNRD